MGSKYFKIPLDYEQFWKVEVLEIVEDVEYQRDSSVLPRTLTQGKGLAAEKSSVLKYYINRMIKVISNELWMKPNLPTEEIHVKQCLDQKKED